METKQALLKVGVEQFGERGYDGVGTRQIAEAAGKQMSAITYHFGSKEGLYRACAEHIADGIGAAMQQVMAEEACHDRAGAVAFVEHGLSAMIDLMTDPTSEHWSLFIMREHQQPTAALDIIAERVFDPMLGRLTDCIVLCRPDLEPQEVRALGMTIVGMPIMLRSARAGVLRHMGAAEMEGEVVDVLRETILANARTLLRVDAAA